MKRNHFYSLIFALMLLVGFAAVSQAETYPMSFDQTYQVALEALDEVGAWRVLETDQLNGIIVLEKGGYFMPRRTAKVIVKRLKPFSTRIELYEENNPRKHKDFFAAIERRVKNRSATYPS